MVSRSAARRNARAGGHHPRLSVVRTVPPARPDLYGSCQLQCGPVPGIPLRHGRDGPRHLLDDLVRRPCVADDRLSGRGHLDGHCRPARHAERLRRAAARRASDARDGDLPQRAASAADRTLTSHPRHGLGLEFIPRHRRHRLGRNRQGRPHRGAPPAHERSSASTGPF